MATSDETARPTVHVIDDDEAVRRALAMLLRSTGFRAETHVSGLAFLDALARPGRVPTECVLSDVRMPGLDGIELLRRLKERGFPGPIIVMTAHGDVSTAVQAMKAGAIDFIEKPFDDEALLSAIGAALDHSVSQKTVTDAAARISFLSPRERQVLQLLTAGKSNKEVARDLGLSSRTVEVHRARLMAHLGVGSLAEAVRLFVQAELEPQAGSSGGSG